MMKLLISHTFNVRLTIFVSKYLGRSSAAPNKFITTLPQGSQNLALGLTTTAASQLAERLSSTMKWVATDYSSPLRGSPNPTNQYPRLAKAITYLA